MKKVRIGFAAIVALAAMSFTIATHSKVFEKRHDLANCYKVITTANYLSSCALPPVFTAIACSKKDSVVSHALKNDLSLSTFSSTTVTCPGGSTLCCISLKSTTADPCQFTPSEQRGDGSLKDLNGNIIPFINFLLVNDVECKP